MQNPTRLPHTSRVNEKIIDYCAKFGRDRDLEKFMRLYSPAESRSQFFTTPTTSVSSCYASEDGGTLRRLFRESAREFVISASKSLPNMEVRENELSVPIRLEGGSVEVAKKENSTSSEDVQTPEKPASESKLTQTPDSIVKSHRRLEWDSLGDVGYKKSMSTSNISVLERTLLKEFFEETSTSSTSSNKATHTNASDGDLKKLQQKHKYKKPLASSTFAEVLPSTNPVESGGARPKYTTQGTCTSLLKQFEKYAQTTMQHPKFSCQEVQVNISSNTSSLVGNSATPSSFEYYSSRSSRSNTTSNDDGSTNQKVSCRRPEHPFISGISEMLARRKVLAERNSQSASDAAQLQQLHNTLKQALTDNKENSSAASLLRSPQVDLGIQLLCSLIDAKSLNNKQKKQLVRDIVKRISLMSSSSSEMPSKNASTIGSLVSERSSKDASAAVYAKSSQRQGREAMKNDVAEKHGEKNSRTNKETFLSKTILESPSEPETSARALEQLMSQKVTNKTRTKVCSVEPKPEYTLGATSVPKVAPLKNKSDKIDKESQIEMPHEQALMSATTQQVTATSTAKQLVPRSPTNASPLSGATTTSSSKELTTQKPVNELNSSNNTDAEEATMREWLNPLTQSEIEYEERKFELARNAKRREKLLRETGKKETDSERAIQINWIETEIQRLESLRHLLLKEDRSVPLARPQEMNKIYDTVCSSSTSVLSANSERAVQEIEVIIEESNEDVVNLEDNCKRTKERKRETQIFYEKPSAVNPYGTGEPQGKARFRTVKETVTTNEEQVLRSAKGQQLTERASSLKPPIQRTKMETPTMGSTDSESVHSFVQQRKRDFMAQYNNKRKNHFDTLQQRQQLEGRPLTTSTGAGPEAREGTEETSGHYSVPHTMPRRHMRDVYTQHPHLPPVSANASAPPAAHISTRTRVSYSASADLASQLHSKQKNVQQQSSSSSMLGISSEMSIPMGSNDSSSTPTTTHQYDDVAVVASFAVGVQTSESVLYTDPICGPAGKPYHVESSSTAQSCACVQLKPKGIAYVIQFDKSSKSTSTSNGVRTSDTTTLPTASNTGETAVPTQQLTLQDHLERARPEFLAQSKERKAILNQIQALRQEREREMREIIENASISSLDNKLNGLPPPPTKLMRVFGTKEMKALTSKHFAQLPEVLERQERECEERRRRGNRVLRDVFNRRLQRRVRNGKLSLNHSGTVI